MFGHDLNQFDSDWHQPGQLLAGAGLNTLKIFAVKINFSFRNSGKICCKFKNFFLIFIHTTQAEDLIIESKIQCSNFNLITALICFFHSI